MSLHHWFIPHHETHKKAKLLSVEALVVYVLMFLILKGGLMLLQYSHPGVLGTSSSIQIQQIIQLTNAERAKQGLAPLQENTALDQAAQGKAQNMFSENYWAHFAPSGKSPWDFILGAGYRFTYAGENLAKNFSNSNDVVTAWMASPSHKENIMNAHYKDIGIAVEDGVINGQKTTLVVQEFGSTGALANADNVAQKAAVPAQANSAPASANPSVAPSIVPTATPVVVPAEEVVQKSQVALAPPVLAQTTSNTPPLFDPIQITKTYEVGVIVLIAGLLMVDFYVLRKRGVFRLTTHHLAHMAILTAATAAVISSHSGDVLKGYSYMAPPTGAYTNINTYAPNP